VASSLVARRLPLARTLKYALAWAAIFAGAVVLYTFRGVAGQAWEQIKREINTATPFRSGRTVRILMNVDGHFHIDARVNSHNVDFMIDSGATTSVMSQADARAANVAIDETGFPVAIETANGMTMMRRAQIGTLDLGGMVRSDHAILVSADAADDVNLLGMNFLSSLKSWRVEGREMVLEP
jgi:aspartyl protease family protein